MSHRTKSHLPPNVGQWEDLNSQHKLFPADKNQRDKVRGKIYMVMLIRKAGNDRKSKGQILLSAWVINTPGQQYGFAEFDDPRDADDAVYELHGRKLLGSRITLEFAKVGSVEPNTLGYLYGCLGT